MNIFLQITFIIIITTILIAPIVLPLIESVSLAKKMDKLGIPRPPR
jgi:hypothetical protein